MQVRIQGDAIFLEDWIQKNVGDSGAAPPDIMEGTVVVQIQ